MKTPRVCLVDWLDSSGASGWQLIEDAAVMEPDPCTSVGFVIAETEDRLTLLQSFTNRKATAKAKDMGDHALTIPKCSITRVVVLRKA